MKWLLYIVILGHVPSAQEPTKWVEAPLARFLPGQEAVRAKTYFDESFGSQKGKFKALYESVLESKDSIEGEFLIARFRYVYSAKNEGGSPIYPTHDEMITKVLLDCPRRFSGTISTTYKLKGKVVKHDDTADQDILMMQYSGVSTVADLCAYAKKRGLVP